MTHAELVGGAGRPTRGKTMKISNSKKQLAQIIHENGGWREGAEFTAQDGDGTGSIDFFKSKPRLYRGDIFWKGDYDCDDRIERTGVTIKNWHQTVLSRDEYFHLYPAPDAEAEQKAEIRWVRGKDIYATPTAHDCMEMLKEKLGSTECGCDECSAFYSKPAAHAESTIEQLAADYRNAKDYADLKKAVELLETPSITAQISNLIGSPIEFVVTKLPKFASKKINGRIIGNIPVDIC